MDIRLNLQNQQILHLENMAPYLSHSGVTQMETHFSA